MFVVNDTDQVVNAVDAVVASGKQLAVRSGGHFTDGLVDDPAVQRVIDLGQMDSVALFSVANFWDNAEEDDKHVTWARTLDRDVFAATGGVPLPNDRTGGCYINWPDPDLLEKEWNQSGVPWSELYCGENYERLQEAKRRWDPTRSSGMFCRSSRAGERASGTATPLRRRDTRQRG